MEKIEHLWNAIQYLSTLKSQGANLLQTFYAERCKRVSLSNKIELPKECFGNSVMCSHCGSLWKSTDPRVRILKGRQYSRSIKRLVKRINNDTDKKVPKVRRTLLEKCTRNQMNKVAMKCSVCSLDTIIAFKKPKRKKLDSKVRTETLQNLSKKKKKKRVKDKTAGLNIPTNLTSKIQPGNSRKTSAIPSTNKPSISKSVTSIQKPKKLNMDRLKDLVKQNTTPSRKRSLHNFLMDL